MEKTISRTSHFRQIIPVPLAWTWLGSGPRQSGGIVREGVRRVNDTWLLSVHPGFGFVSGVPLSVLGAACTSETNLSPELVAQLAVREDRFRTPSHTPRDRCPPRRTRRRHAAFTPRLRRAS